MTEKNKLTEQFKKEQKEIEEAKKKTSNPDESKEFMDDVGKRNTSLILRDSTKVVTYEKSLSIVTKLAEYYITSKMNSDKLSKQDLILKMLKGHELGLEFIQSIDQINIIKERPSLSAQVMHALIRTRMPFSQIYIDECTKTRCKIRAKRDRRDPNEVFLPIIVNIDDYEFYLQKDNWKRHPADMLFARCISQMARRLFPDVIQGMYTTEEVMDFDDLPLDEGIDPEYLEHPKPNSIQGILAQEAKDMAALQDIPVVVKTNGNAASEALRKAEAQFKRLKKAFPNDMIPFPQWRDNFWEKNIKWLPPNLEEKMRKEFEDSKKNGLLNQSLEVYRDNWITEAETQEVYPA